MSTAFRSHSYPFVDNLSTPFVIPFLIRVPSWIKTTLFPGVSAQEKKDLIF